MMSLKLSLLRAEIMDCSRWFSASVAAMTCWVLALIMAAAMKQSAENAHGSRNWLPRLTGRAKDWASGPALGSTMVICPACSGWPCPGEKIARTLSELGMGLASIMTVSGLKLPYQVIWAVPSGLAVQR